MVKRVNPVSPKHVQGTVPPSKTPRSLQTLRDAVVNFMKGRGKSALGKGKPPTFSTKPTRDANNVIRAAKGSPVLPKRPR